jgi:hypothetical protein
LGRPWSLQVGFASWSQIDISAGCDAHDTAVCAAPANAMIRVVLKQAYHPHWSAPGCETQASARGNLTLECPAARLRKPVEVIFRDAVSEAGAQVSLVAWQILVLIAGAAAIVSRRTHFQGRHIVTDGN